MFCNPRFSSLAGFIPHLHSIVTYKFPKNHLVLTSTTNLCKIIAVFASIAIHIHNYPIHPIQFTTIQCTFPSIQFTTIQCTFTCHMEFPQFPYTLWSFFISLDSSELHQCFVNYVLQYTDLLQGDLVKAMSSDKLPSCIPVFQMIFSFPSVHTTLACWQRSFCLSINFRMSQGSVFLSCSLPSVTYMLSYPTTSSFHYSFVTFSFSNCTSSIPSLTNFMNTDFKNVLQWRSAHSGLSNCKKGKKKQNPDRKQCCTTLHFTGSSTITVALTVALNIRPHGGLSLVKIYP